MPMPIKGMSRLVPSPPLEPRHHDTGRLRRVDYPNPWLRRRYRLAKIPPAMPTKAGVGRILLAAVGTEHCSLRKDMAALAL